MRSIKITIWLLLLSQILLLSILLSLLLSSLLKDWVEFPLKLAIFICLTYNLIKMHYFAFFFVTFHLMLVFWICRVGHKFERISNKHFKYVAVLLLILLCLLVIKYGLFIVAFKLIANENMPLARFCFNKPFCFTVSLCVDSLDLKLNPQLSKIKF